LEETIQKLRVIGKEKGGHSQSEETREKLRNINTGKKQSKETIMK